MNTLCGNDNECFYFRAWDHTICFVACLQIFFLQGRFIFGPDVRSLGLTIFLIVAPVTVFCVFVARKLMDDYSHHLGISIMAVVVIFTFYVSSPFLSLSVIFISYLYIYIYIYISGSCICFVPTLTMEVSFRNGLLFGFTDEDLS